MIDKDYKHLNIALVCDIDGKQYKQYFYDTSSYFEIFNLICSLVSLADKRPYRAFTSYLEDKEKNIFILVRFIIKKRDILMSESGHRMTDEQFEKYFRKD